MAGPLTGIKIIEIGGLGPAPFCAMVLADLGAEILRVERPGKTSSAESVAVYEDLAKWDLLSRGRLSAGVDLKHPDGVALVSRLAAGADAFIEGFRPGVAERLGIGPDVLCAANPRLVYGRMTGWGQSGPMAARAGHDIDYLALAGVLAHIGRADQPPTPPLNLVADFGGGGLLLALGICAALVERATSDQGQVVDAAMIDGAALLMAPLFGAHATGYWSDDRGTNLLDSGAPFYDCYRCSDGGFVAVGAMEPGFWNVLLIGLDLHDDLTLPDQNDQSRWPELRQRLTERFLTRTRDEWATIFEGADACVAPVLTMGEAPSHPHHVARGTFAEVNGVVQPAPAPRFSRTPATLSRPPQLAGANTEEVLAAWGIDDAERQRLRDSGAIA